MTTIKVELSDAAAQAARDAGLLTSQALERLAGSGGENIRIDEMGRGGG